MKEQKIHLWLSELKAADFGHTFDTLSERGIYVNDPPKMAIYWEGIEVEAILDTDEYAIPVDPVIIADVVKDLYGISVMVPGRVIDEDQNEDRE